MAKATGTGTAQSESAKDFNDRVKRLLSAKPDPFEGVTSRPARASGKSFQRKG